MGSMAFIVHHLRPLILKGNPKIATKSRMSTYMKTHDIDEVASKIGCPEKRDPSLRKGPSDTKPLNQVEPVLSAEEPAHSDAGHAGRRHPRQWCEGSPT